MAGLVCYASSDEEDDTSRRAQSPKMSSSSKYAGTESTTIEPSKEAPISSLPSNKSTPGQQPSQSGPTQPEGPQASSSQDPLAQAQPQIIGPVFLGPSLPPSEAILTDLPEPPETPTPSSPYTSTRSLIHDLTLPSVPNLDIPPSPPGSPPPQTTSKFQQFLALKRQGTHFNSKLEQSAALRNPSLTDKLLSFVDLSGSAQYETTLPLGLYDPSGFPEWSYRDKLRKARESVVKEREEKTGGRSSIEFVSGSVNPPGTRGGISREKRKGGWK
ncbi:HCNGP-like protein [Metarhizium rileyi]|uniref:HCNGP-like protein n=1 Tax=Metarhizium rileyi (strain RCEF 4871) TaxID=1649241 RepID=A0A167IN19_METRR|nr:HCNGP-like protein [Metarhizium rileyi RCEF 4871]